MEDLDLLRNKIEEYNRKFRKIELPPIKEGKVYSLNKEQKIDGAEPTLFWPDVWDNNDRKGIYGIFHHRTLLYIGKASQQTLGHRLGDYFRYGSEKYICVTNPKHTWSKEPTHVITWAVPDEMFFEASALEEFLIYELSELVCDNTLGKRA
jgi:hypothetical protein